MVDSLSIFPSLFEYCYYYALPHICAPNQEVTVFLTFYLSQIKSAVQEMATLTGEFFYHLVVNNVAPIMAASVTSVYTTYFSGRGAPTPTLIRSEDDERELDLLQMDRMLKWMNLIFEDSNEMVVIPSLQCRAGEVCKHAMPCPDATTPDSTQKAYKKELYSIYVTIGSDYSQYRRWKEYNAGVWVFSSYRNKDTKALAKKILADVKLFHEGLKMFSLFEKL
jgi:hypothetical protein